MSKMPIDTSLPRLLVIDDNPDITDIIETIASETGFAVRCVNDYREIRSTYRDFDPELIFLDLDLGLDDDMDLSEKGYDGLTVFKFLEEQNCIARIVLVSGMDKEKRQVTKNLGREMKLNVIGSVPKPFSIEKIEKLLMQLKRDQTATDL
ncbi:MAG: response regulator [Gammaproteobacteria bacterium]|nr:response regulator [Gammaproteobacteria bacterium]